MPLPRMTTRRWLVAVAVVGVLLGAGVTWYRWSALSEEYTRRSGEYEENAKTVRYLLRRPLSVKRRVWVASWIVYSNEQTEKYRRAARYPWLSVAPDSPSPGPIPVDPPSPD